MPQAEPTRNATSKVYADLPKMVARYLRTQFGQQFLAAAGKSELEQEIERKRTEREAHMAAAARLADEMYELERKLHEQEGK